MTVAPPFEIALYPRDQFSLSQRLKLEADAPDLLSLTRSWEESQRRAFAALLPFAWEAEADRIHA